MQKGGPAMLETMFFDVTRGGVHSQIDIWVKEGLVYHKARLFGGWPDLNVRPDEPCDFSTEWLMRLSRLNLGAYEARYHSDQPEDVTWTIHFKEVGKDEVRSSGVGAYPPGWDELLLLMDELAPEAGFIDPELIENIYMVYTDHEETEFGPAEYMEEMSLDRRSQKLIYRRAFNDDIYTQTEYKNMNEVSIGLDMWDRFFDGAPSVSLDDSNPIEPPRFEVYVDRHDGSQEHYLWHYNRTCLPDGWARFMGMIGHRLQLGTMFINIISPSLYMHGAKADEVIYATVRIPEVGRSYYYITNDNSLRKGDKVLVPYGPDHVPTSGEISKIDYFLPDQVTVPMDQVDPIFGRDFDVEKEIKK